jgi:hypothetical protein
MIPGSNLFPHLRRLRDTTAMQREKPLTPSRW